MTVRRIVKPEILLGLANLNGHTSPCGCSVSTDPAFVRNTNTNNWIVKHFKICIYFVILKIWNKTC